MVPTRRDLIVSGEKKGGKKGLKVCKQRFVLPEGRSDERAFKVCGQASRLHGTLNKGGWFTTIMERGEPLNLLASFLPSYDVPFVRTNEKR